MSQYVPCGRCQSTNVERMNFTWWGGLLGPRLLTHVKCNRCGATYNGKTGKSNTTAIIIYTIIGTGISLALIFALFLAMYLSR